MDANNALYSTTDELDLCTINIFLGEGVMDDEGVAVKYARRAAVGVIKGSSQTHLKTEGG